MCEFLQAIRIVLFSVQFYVNLLRLMTQLKIFQVLWFFLVVIIHQQSKVFRSFSFCNFVPLFSSFWIFLQFHMNNQIEKVTLILRMLVNLNRVSTDWYLTSRSLNFAWYVFRLVASSLFVNFRYHIVHKTPINTMFPDFWNFICHLKNCYRFFITNCLLIINFCKSR